MSEKYKNVHFCPQVDVYQPVLMGQAILLKKQALNDEEPTNGVLSCFQRRRIKLRQLLHQRHLARKRRRAE